MQTKTGLAAALAVAAALGLGGSAFAAEIGDRLGTTVAEIGQTLEADGYEVRKVELEDGKIEVYALRDGRRWEIYVDPRSGAVTRMKEDD